MVATFRSLVQPFILLVSVPFAATGALLALLLSGTSLGIAALIGLLMLVGIVVTNAIVLIDLVNQCREQGQPVAEAVVNGARQRLRPILMTALATIGALTPMALGLTGGSAFISQSLAVVVIGGLISSTALTLILVPVIYGLVEGGRERRRAQPTHSAEAEADSRPWGHAQMVPDDRVVALEQENVALKRMVAEAELRQMALRESARRAVLPGPADDDQGTADRDDRGEDRWDGAPS